ncbi:hypothetical protein ULF88_08665 [Halopseudomonas pachastrellae]|nr:hypothetical protein [Halopseudomonas pachastrellae]
MWLAACCTSKPLQGILGLERNEQGDGLDGDMQRLAAAQDIAQVHQLVVQEARNALEETREAINAFIANQWDHRQLEPIDDCSPACAVVCLWYRWPAPPRMSPLAAAISANN